MQTGSYQVVVVGTALCYSLVNSVTIYQSQILLCKYKVKPILLFMDMLIELKALK